MGEDSDTQGQFIEVIDPRIDLPPFQRADVGSLKSALEAQLFLGPAE